MEVLAFQPSSSLSGVGELGAGCTQPHFLTLQNPLNKILCPPSCVVCKGYFRSTGPPGWEGCLCTCSHHGHQATPCAGLVLSEVAFTRSSATLLSSSPVHITSLSSKSSPSQLYIPCTPGRRHCNLHTIYYVHLSVSRTVSLLHVQCCRYKHNVDKEIHDTNSPAFEHKLLCVFVNFPIAGHNT